MLLAETNVLRITRCFARIICRKSNWYNRNFFRQEPKNNTDILNKIMLLKEKKKKKKIIKTYKIDPTMEYTMVNQNNEKIHTENTLLK